MPSMVATLQALVDELRATVAEHLARVFRLEERVWDLETRVGQHLGNSSRPPSSDLPGVPDRPATGTGSHWLRGAPGDRIASDLSLHHRVLPASAWVPVVWGVDPGITARWGPHWIVRSPGAGNRLSRQITDDGVIG